VPLYNNIKDARAEIERLNKEIKKLGGKGFKNIDDAIKNMGGGLEGANALVKNLNASVRDLETDFRGISSTIADIERELTKSDLTVNRTKGALRTTQNILQDMLSDEQGISTLSEKDLTTKIAKAKQQKIIVTQQAEELKKQGITLKNAKGEHAEILGQAAAMDDNNSIIDTLIGKMEKRLEQEKKVNKSLGS